MTRRRAGLIVVATVVLMAAACGDSADNTTTTVPVVTEAPATPATPTTTPATALTTTTTTVPPTATTSAPTTTTVPPPTTTSMPEQLDAEAFFRGALEVCNAYSIEVNDFAPFDGSGADPTIGVTFDNEVAPGVYEVVDSDGVVLRVDFTNRVVTGIDGPDGVMPRPYSFWCPPELFPGTLDEGGFDTEALLLQPDGLGIVDFGEDPDVATARISELLGPPDEDTGWIDAFSTWGTCPGSQIRVVRWDNLEILHTDAPDTFASYPAPGIPHFFNWRTPDLFLVGADIGLSTPEGIGVGSTVAQLGSVYGAAVEILYEDVFDIYFLRLLGDPGTGISGSVSGDQPTDVVQFLEAGATCGE